MNDLMLDQQKNDRIPKKNKKVVLIVNNSILMKPLFDTESYYYFTEIWKYRPYS
jgi:hypothetical protein